MEPDVDAAELVDNAAQHGLHRQRVTRIKRVIARALRFGSAAALTVAARQRDLRALCHEGLRQRQTQGITGAGEQRDLTGEARGHRPASSGRPSQAIQPPSTAMVVAVM